MNRRGLIYRLIVVAGLVAAIAWLAFHRGVLEPSGLERELRRFGRWAPILFIGLYAASTVLFVPGSLLTLSAGFLFGHTAGLGVAKSGRLGSIAAAEIISHIGARPETPLAELARRKNVL